MVRMATAIQWCAMVRLLSYSVACGTRGLLEEEEEIPRVPELCCVASSLQKKFRMQLWHNSDVDKLKIGARKNPGTEVG